MGGELDMKRYSTEAEAIIICSPSRGRYAKPVELMTSGVTWFSEVHGRIVRGPSKVRCENPKHQGHRLWFDSTECYVRFWELTKKEIRQAIEEYDMLSSDVPPQILCPNCSRKEKA